MTLAGGTGWLKATRSFWDTDSAFEAKYRRILSDPEIDATTDEAVLQQLWEKRTNEELPQLLNGIPLQRDWTSLEIGCGIGRLLRPIAARCRRVIGVDISESMVALAKDELGDVSNAEVYANDGLRFPFVESDSVDWVYSHLAFQHMTLPEVVESNLAECARVLRPGGYLRVQTWCEAAVPISQRVKNVARALLGIEPYHGPRGWTWAPGRDVRFGGVTFHPRPWRRLLKSNGFRVLSLQCGEGHDYWMWCTCRKI